MKNECDIVQDLLFSYNDGVLSETSTELVEEHLKKCEKCKKVLEEIRKENDEKSQIKEVDFFKSIKKNINKKQGNRLVFYYPFQSFLSLITLADFLLLSSEIAA